MGLCTGNTGGLSKEIMAFRTPSPTYGVSAIMVRLIIDLATPGFKLDDWA
jgi:hypothetical protein